MANRTVTASILLDCKHRLNVRGIPPSIGSEIRCRKCGEVRLVDIAQAEYRARCTQCRYSRGYGTARITALTKATKHAIQKHHKVNVWLGRKVIETVGKNVAQLTLPEDDTPPF
jgi:hypothetical protein